MSSRACTENEDKGESLRKISALSPTKFWIVILCLSLVISLYFAIFGSPISFRNFFNSLTDERKKELSNELRLKLVSTSESQLSLLNTPKKRKYLMGINYSPKGAYEPFCLFSKEDAIRDLSLISTVTLKIRTYGTQCNQMEHLLKAIDILRLDMKISMGIWLSNDEIRNKEQVDKAKEILLNSDTTIIQSIYIGNEALRRGDISEIAMISYIKDVKSYLDEKKIHIPVGISEFPSSVTQNLVDSCDIVGFTIQPFLAGIQSTESAKWSMNRFNALKTQFYNGKTHFAITEIGWPYQGGEFKRAKASPSDHKTFMHSWISNSAKSPTEDWFYYEAFNEPWKIRFNKEPDTWEAEWGLFDDQKRPRSDVQFVDGDQR
ncbi:glycoside hydrolase [Metschnikowia bicuspidata var. bicuspidata NRRL YB-4993]|uniref:glucan endo-1,3-beta-D-glucosidase n=1 Tax=Metschnikowia bicuspidata var. bicuspidata NRRL YB-4993 TaxID=869754 RepID=A0A1A0H549_9ASCO|nr:glycoside hydrolase [Metschnikowia bicuspidata var. bicuspidata NRRL YB-4993]OBA19048.1 glycoside hydrolase [Metschnikowia bicuspidata var. bicuspidata NRRL YB-4993]